MVYFSSGLAGAMGFLLFKWMSRSALAWLNIAASSLAIICYHWSYTLFQKQCIYKKNSSTTNEDNNGEGIVTILDNSLQTSKLRHGRQSSLEVGESEDYKMIQVNVTDDCDDQTENVLFLR